ncbi:hypothetical protein RvY_15983-2 [Ramazzottius varieornatus]|uniref:Transmembrane protein n=1 Tax=Ramazzottius varieornatus TaxID=947166 RepID=A0A1D1VWV1_RAMVA|nr:hypothetical protein RvY_15983-2 [Ramazzottius varieornatus]
MTYLASYIRMRRFLHFMCPKHPSHLSGSPLLLQQRHSHRDERNPNPPEEMSGRPESPSLTAARSQRKKMFRIFVASITFFVISSHFLLPYVTAKTVLTELNHERQTHGPG